MQFLLWQNEVMVRGLFSLYTMYPEEGQMAGDFFGMIWV
jgi:hypothetical protein